MGGRKNLIVSLLVLFFAGVAHAAEKDTGASVVLIYNSSMPVSKEVADHYAAQRQVPAEQIFAFDLPQVETISREDFTTKLQQPLWKELRSRKLLTYGDAESNGSFKSHVTEAKVRYVVLCYGVPLKITPDTALKENVDQFPQELRRNEAAVESELSILPLLDQKPLVTGPFNNPVGLATNQFAVSPTNGVLMVARIDGPTPEIAKSLVDKAIQAEKDGLWGNAYFDTRSITNAGFKQADDMLNAAAELAKLYGFEVVKETSSRTFPPTTPLPDIALYFGWYDQSVSGPFTNGMAEFRPGAIAYHLHSFSSRNLRVSNVWWTGPLLAAGATATMGFTEEPYLHTTPQINVFLYRFVQLGFSFGEAAYACMPSLSWQTAVIGDPLYRPFYMSQQARYEELERRKDKNVDWSMLMWVNFRLTQNAPFDEILQFYKTNPTTQQSAVLQEKLGDIYKSKGKLIDAMGPYGKALKLPMSPLRKLRLGLKAAPIFASMGRAEQAYSIYQQILRENPAYPDKKEIYERLSGVAMRLKKTEEAAEFQRLARDQAQP
jgi:uncharacterized protein (TIGR03790 family)